jgi:hypothetical protein
VQQAEPQAAQLAGTELLERLGGRGDLQLVRPLDERADDVGLAALGASSSGVLAQTVRIFWRPWGMTSRTLTSRSP